MEHHGPPQDGRANMNASFVNTSLFGVAISLPILSTASVILRFYARTWAGDGRFKAHDWTVLVTLIPCWGHSINTLVAAGLGGINTITIPPRDYATLALRTLWISTFFLVTALFTVKVSILLFYHHLFSIKNRFKQACIVMIAILTLWWISSVIAIFLTTDPVEGNWINPAQAKHRFNYKAWFTSYTGISIFFDVVILCFPIPMIKSLRVNTRQKVSILGIFWLGGFVCVSAIIRFVYLYDSTFLTDGNNNPYNSITMAFIWAEVEPNTSVIAACLPTYSPLFKNLNALPNCLRSLRSKLGMSKEDRQDYGPSHVGDRSSNGYYELDKTISSKSVGNIFTERGISDPSNQIKVVENGGDISLGDPVQRSDSFPRAYLPR